MANEFGTNIKTNVKDGKLTLTIDLKVKGKESASGKSMLIASSGGPKEVPGTGGLKIGLNLYKEKVPSKGKSRRQSDGSED
jgi:hypothetical protein